MAYQTYPWWSNDFDLFPDAYPHRYTNSPSSRRLRAPRWAFPELASGLCCEFCVIHDNIPSLEGGLFELGMVAPPYFDRVLDAYECIHYHYKRGFDQDDPESYYVLREIERLSKLLRKLYFATGRNTHTSPRRYRSSIMPKRRYNRAPLMPLLMY